MIIDVIWMPGAFWDRADYGTNFQTMKDAEAYALYKIKKQSDMLMLRNDAFVLQIYVKDNEHDFTLKIGCFNNHPFAMNAHDKSLLTPCDLFGYKCGSHISK